MANSVNFDKNISYFMIPVALIIPLSARYYSGIAGPGRKILDPQNPRNFTESLKNSSLDEKLRGRLIRAEACCANGFEALPVFAAAVTAGNSAGLSAFTMNALSLSWVASRILYNYVYIVYQEREKLARGQIPLRTKVWGLGVMLYMSMFILAGMSSGQGTSKGFFGGKASSSGWL